VPHFGVAVRLTRAGLKSSMKAAQGRRWRKFDSRRLSARRVQNITGKRRLQSHLRESAKPVLHWRPTGPHGNLGLG